MLDKAEEESKRREEGGGERELFCFFLLLEQLWETSSSLNITDLSHSPLVFNKSCRFCCLCFSSKGVCCPRSPAANHTQAFYTVCMFGKWHTCHSVLEKGNRVLFLSPGAQRDEEERAVVGKGLSDEGPEVKRVGI